MKTAIAILAITTLILISGVGWLAYGFYESDTIRPHSLAYYLVLPRALRTLKLPAPCNAPVYSKSLIECGGICGTIYSMRYQTHLPKAAAQAYFAAQLPTKNPKFFISKGTIIKGKVCRAVYFDFINDDRTGTTAPIQDAGR